MGRQFRSVNGVMRHGVSGYAVGMTSNSTIVQFIARLGFFASGVIHILIGVIAIQVAVGGGGAEADQSGALSKLASAPGGVVLL